MRANVSSYELRQPRDLGDALAILAREPGVWRPFAGGTDLMVLFEAGLLEHRKFINIWNLSELKGITTLADSVTLGGLTTYSDVQRDPVLQTEFPMLCTAANETGGIAIQNRGTIAGNIANASPAGDSPPALLVYDAEIELVSESGARWVPYEGFHTGYKKTVMRPDELIRSVRLPRNKNGWLQYYRKVGTRKAQAIAKVCFAGAMRLDGAQIVDIRLALGSVAPIPIRCSHTEDALRGKSLGPDLMTSGRAALESEIVPIDDIRSTAAYRLQVAGNLLEDFLSKGKSI